jgi:hypothetical protein
MSPNNPPLLGPRARPQGRLQSSALARQQQALLGALFIWPPQTAIENMADYACWTGERGLKAYQTNGHELALRALLAAYPVLAQLLGDESFAAFARAFWHSHPPTQGDLAQWGGGLAAFVQASAQLADEPYLGDMARLEWALHTCAGSADKTADPASFALLMEHDPAGLTLVLAPGCAVLPSAWPIASILRAHLQAHLTAPLTTPLAAASPFDKVGQQLRDRVAQTAIVWRQGHLPRAREAGPGEAALLAGLLAGDSLDAAITGAPDLDFNTWLPMAVQTGLLLAAQTL